MRGFLGFLWVIFMMVISFGLPSLSVLLLDSFIILIALFLVSFFAMIKIDQHPSWPIWAFINNPFVKDSKSSVGAFIVMGIIAFMSFAMIAFKIVRFFAY